MKVTAKFRCWSVTSPANADPNTTLVQVQMMPVWEQEGPNRTWSKATPSGQLLLHITNPDAINWFEQGKCYDLAITPSAA